MFAICFQNKHVFCVCGERKEGDLKENTRWVLSYFFDLIANANCYHKLWNYELGVNEYFIQETFKP